MTGERAGARERILHAAYRLFTRHGLDAVGVDRVISEAGVAKSTLYRHFRSKDELIIAVLDRRDATWTQAWLRAEVERRASNPLERLLAIFDALDEWFQRDDFEGCLFITSLLETDDHTSPVYAATVAAMGRVRAIIRDLAAEAGAGDPESVARRLHILMTGSIVGAEEGALDAARSAREVAALVLEAEGFNPS